MVMAQVIHEKGGPEKFVWEKVALDPPEEGEVHIRNLAIGVNFADTYHRRGWPHPLVVGAPPIVVGFEAVSTVVAVGPGLTRCKRGDKVCHCTPPIGSYAEEQFYPAEQLIRVPDGLA
jgi:NADPH:quinone reductase-like Zn-dependent oxidoreductase